MHLTAEMSNTLAEFYNQTGLRQISFDGLEGNRSTGLGTYGESLMPYTWYNALAPELKDHLIIDASRTTHFFWRIYSRMNWGEPWYAGFRESQTQYRFNNQAYFQRNFMPGMLGWFKMTARPVWKTWNGCWPNPPPMLPAMPWWPMPKVLPKTAIPTASSKR